jgi:nucleotide-binding universal stress UspA family protein
VHPPLPLIIKVKSAHYRKHPGFGFSFFEKLPVVALNLLVHTNKEALMEKILVGLDPGKTSLWAAVHALNLAKRIQARLYFLLVIDTAAKGSDESLMRQIEVSIKTSLESLIQEGISEGIPVDYYITYGQYDNELVKFVKENRITMLVVGSPTSQEGRLEDFNNLLEKIRHRIDCRIEVVHERAVKTTRKKGG